MKKIEKIKLKVVSDGTTGGTRVKTPNGNNIGLVQSIKWEIKIGEPATCAIQTLLTKSELTALVENTEINYKLLKSK